MGTPVDGPSFWDWVCEVARMREANASVAILTLETKSADHPAHSAQESSSIANSMPLLMSRAGSCAAHRNVELVMKPKLRYGSSRRLRQSRRTAGTSSIRASLVLVLETGSGAQNAILT